jgi:hypothetical protein
LLDSLEQRPSSFPVHLVLSQELFHTIAKKLLDARVRDVPLDSVEQRMFHESPDTVGADGFMKVYQCVAARRAVAEKRPLGSQRQHVSERVGVL